MLNWKLFIKEV